MSIPRILRPAALVVAALLSVATLPSGAQQLSTPITDGQTYFMSTHSFNVFIGPDRRGGSEGPLQALADEAGLEGHQNVGVQMIGGSTPMQHWNQGADDETRNTAKVALRAGGVDVLTLSPNAVVPEEGIDLFGDLMIETNPEGRILVQVSWSAWDGNGSTSSVGGSGAEGFSNADRDHTSIETIDGWVQSLHREGGYLDRLRAQLEGIDQRAGRSMAYVVPASDAVYRLRREVALGGVPGIERQSELFRDPIGHATTPVQNLVTYAWFAVMYRQSPVGMTALVEPDDPTSAERERLLQEISWDAVLSEPMSGVVER